MGSVGVPQRSVSLFNIFVNNMDGGADWTLSKFVDDTKMSSAVNMLEGRDAIQRDLDCIEKWGYMNLKRYNKGKVLHLG